MPARRRELETYRKKRDFSRTPEPSGPATLQPSGRNRFVVQRHRARRLHYDLRLEIDGTLASWAVPKGPTLDPKARVLAVQVEDHPLEYYDFEGVIPAGEYGGGDVIVWDWGTWEPAGRRKDPAKAIEAGELHFDLHGEKLAGRFVLVRRDDGGGGKANWLLIHKRDDHAEEGWDPEAHPRSVKSGRTNDEVKAAPDTLWRSDLPAAEAAIALAPSAADLEALDGLGAEGTWSLGGRELRLTNLDKVLFPGRGGGPSLTKRDLIRYHATIAPAMLPYLVDRPLALHRYPNGIGEPGYWHKARPRAPSWIGAWRNDEADPGEIEVYLTVEDAAGLAWLANYGTVEVHPWASTVADLHRPTWAFIDIDPGTATTFEDVVVLARLHRTALDHLGVAGAPKVTGGRGIQIWVPVAPHYTFEETRAWVESLSRAIGATVPELVSWRWKKADREGKVRLDYTQNAINKTLVAPFSARPAPGAPVSVPIEWDELDDPALRPDRWTIRDVHDRLAEAGDPLVKLIGRRQGLPRIS
jgi:bifunctional non-homologous end joining protein LigD